MLNETHKDYQTYLKNGGSENGLASNAVAFGTIAKKHAAEKAQSVWDAIKFEINDWRNAKWSDFKPRIPSRHELFASASFIFIWAFTLPLMAACMLMQVGDKPRG